MDKLSKEEVLHIADLGKLDLSDEEVDKFSYQLKSLFNEIDKVNEIDVNVEKGIFSPLDNKCELFPDDYTVFEKPEKLIENAPETLENFIEVAGVFDE